MFPLLPIEQQTTLRIFYREAGRMWLIDRADDMSDALQLASNAADWHPEQSIFIVDYQGKIIH